MIGARIVAGSLFLLIIVVNVLAARYGYQTFSDLDSEKKLKSIGENPKRFRIAFILIIIEHLCIIGVAAAMFIAFREFNPALAVVWTVFRTVEGVVQIYFKKDYRGLRRTAELYTSADEDEKKRLIGQVRTVLETKNRVFEITQILFSFGTLSYSVMFVAYTVIPVFIGWFGIAASVIYGLGSFIKLVKDNQAVWNVGGLMILVFELVLGGWLVINTIINS